MQAERSLGRACWRLGVLTAHILSALLLTRVYRLRYGQGWFDTVPGKEMIQQWMQRACRILAIRLQVQGTPCVVQDTLFVANHISWVDIIALSTLLDAKYISKSNVRHWPVFGRLAVAIGTLFIDRDKQFAVNGVIDGIHGVLAGSQSILVFPEGTTTDGQQVGRFYPALFKAVSGSSHFVQAIALCYRRQGQIDKLVPYIGDDNFVMHLLRIASLRQTCLDVIFTAPFQPLIMNRYDIAAATHAAIENVLQGQPAISPAAQRLVA